jgi:hypothetical protein
MRWVLITTLALAACPARAGHVDISGGISLFTPPEPGADATPLYRVAASYWFTKRAAVNAEVAYAGYRTEGVNQEEDGPDRLGDAVRLHRVDGLELPHPPSDYDRRLRRVRRPRLALDARVLGIRVQFLGVIFVMETHDTSRQK